MEKAQVSKPEPDADLETNRRREEEEIADARTTEGIESKQRSRADSNTANISMETEETVNADLEKRIIFTTSKC